MTDPNTSTDLVIAEAQDTSEQLNQLQVYIQQGVMAPAQIIDMRDQIGAHLGALHAAAEESGNQELSNYAIEAWDYTQQITAQAEAALNVTVAAVTIATTMREQRDVAIDERDGAIDERMAMEDDLNNAILERNSLEEDVRYQNLDNPLVASLVDDVAQGVWENESESMYEDAMEQAAEEADSEFVRKMARLCDIEADDVHVFLSELYESEYPDAYLHTQYPAITAEHRQQFGALIASVAAAVRDAEHFRAAERLRQRQEHERRWAEQRAQRETERAAQAHADLDDDGYDGTDADA